MNVSMGETELREQLMTENEEYRRLATEHQSYAERLELLKNRHHLSEEEKFQEIMLKKKKLFLKDQMYSLLQKYRREMAAES